MPVDVGFKYLIRVHLSVLGVKTAESVDNVLEVLINEMIAQTNIDAVEESDETNIPSYRDYMVLVKGNKKEGKRDILFSLKSYDDRGLVSGFEIFKLSNYDNSLASPNPLPLARDSPSDTVLQALFSVIVERNAIGTVAIAVISLMVRQFRRGNQQFSLQLCKISHLHLMNKLITVCESRSISDLCRRFSLEEIKAATCNFGNNSIIHKGFFSDVYKGLIEDGATTAAIKRLNPKSTPDTHEFLDITTTLSKLRHLHLVSPIGYCDEGGEMILVYDYMAHGSLRDRLNNSEKYLHRAAKGLHHCLHAGIGDRNMQRNINTANILLDEEWVAKFCVAPRRIISGKKRIARTPHSQTLKQYMDTNLYNQIAPDCLSKFIETTLACRNRN
ncbi:hypothetical protein MIMGU_mgv1a023725mg, partial [Erythranthe guttata]